MKVTLTRALDSHNVNYSEFTQGLLEEENRTGLVRRNTELILDQPLDQPNNMLETIPEVISTDSKLDFQADHFATHSRGESRREELYGPVRRRRA